MKTSRVTLLWLALLIGVASQQIVYAQSLSSSSSSGSSSFSSSSGSSSSSSDGETISVTCEDLGLHSVAVSGKQGVFCVAQQPCSGKQSQIAHFACPVAGQRALTDASSTLANGSCCAVINNSNGLIGCLNLDNMVRASQCLPTPDWYTPGNTTTSAEATSNSTTTTAGRISRALSPSPTSPQATTNGTTTPAPSTTKIGTETTSQEPEAGDPNTTSDVPTPTPTPSPYTTPPSTPTPVTPTPSPSPVTPTPPVPVPSPSPRPNQGSQSSGSSPGDVGGDGDGGNEGGLPSGDGSHTNTGSSDVSSDADKQQNSEAGIPTDSPTSTQDPATLRNEDETRNDFATMVPIIEDTPNPTVSRMSDSSIMPSTTTAQPTASSTGTVTGSVSDNTLVFIVVGAIACVAVVVGAAILRRKRPERSESLRGLEAATPAADAPRAEGRYGASSTPRDGMELM